MTDEAMKQLFKELKTPPCEICAGVLARLHTQGSKRHRRTGKKLLLSAAVIAAGTLLFLGARGLWAWQYFHPDGSVEEALVASSETASIEEYQTEIAPILETPKVQPGEFLITIADGIFGYGSPGMTFEAEEIGKARELVKSAAVPLRYPQSMPDGFQFKEARTRFYFSADMKNAPTKELTDAGNGYYYQIIALPKGYQRNIEAYVLHYEDDTGRSVEIEAQCTQGKGDGVFGPGQAQSESVKTKNMGNGVMVQVPEDPTFSTPEQCVLAFEERIPPVETVSGFRLGREERVAKGLEKGLEKGDVDTRIILYDHVSYQLTGTGLTKEELLSIAEGLLPL